MIGMCRRDAWGNLSCPGSDNAHPQSQGMGSQCSIGGSSTQARTVRGQVAGDMPDNQIVNRLQRCQAEHGYIILFFGNDGNFPVWFLTLAFGGNTGMVAQLHMDDPPLIGWHWFQQLAPAGLHGLISHALCQCA